MVEIIDIFNEKKRLIKNFYPHLLHCVFKAREFLKKIYASFREFTELHDKLYLNHLYFYDKYKKLLSVAWAKIETTL